MQLVQYWGCLTVVCNGVVFGCSKFSTGLFVCSKFSTGVFAFCTGVFAYSKFSTGGVGRQKVQYWECLQ